jgi:hypothetical protein
LHRMSFTMRFFSVGANLGATHEKEMYKYKYTATGHQEQLAG